MCRILNKHHGAMPPTAIYIGRGSRWGNPRSCGRRVSCLPDYHRYRAEDDV
jgi:hypothetical protein